MRRCVSASCPPSRSFTSGGSVAPTRRRSQSNRAFSSAPAPGRSLHEALARGGFVLRRGTGTIVAAAATAEDARLLGLRAGDPLLVERRVIADGHGRRIEATESRYPADRYALDVRFDVDETGVAPDRLVP
jgi:hypothetical protein